MWSSVLIFLVRFSPIFFLFLEHVCGCFFFGLQLCQNRSGFFLRTFFDKEIASFPLHYGNELVIIEKISEMNKRSVNTSKETSCWFITLGQMFLLYNKFWEQRGEKSFTKFSHKEINIYLPKKNWISFISKMISNLNHINSVQLVRLWIHYFLQRSKTSPKSSVLGMALNYIW